MAPDLLWQELPEGSGKIVLDPMAGSGSTLVAAKHRGHEAIGFDTDPLAVLLASTWLTPVNTAVVDEVAIKLLGDASMSSSAGNSPQYPELCDNETRDFITFWFDPQARTQLTALAMHIGALNLPEVRPVLWVAFSRMIITKAKGVSLAMDVSHSRPHKKYLSAPVEPLKAFLPAVRAVLRRLPFNGQETVSGAAHLGDARCLPLEANSVDFVMTSPPYLNAIDYVRGHKLALVWMGHSIAELRRLRSSNVGAETGLREDDTVVEVKDVVSQMTDGTLTPQYLRKLNRFATDMDMVMRQIKRVLRPGGRAVFVVGDSSIRGTFVSNSNCVISTAEQAGLNLVSRDTRPIPPNRRYLPPPNRTSSGPALDKRMSQEVIIRFDKEPL